jgi:hypothetical protein
MLFWESLKLSSGSSTVTVHSNHPSEGSGFESSHSRWNRQVENGKKLTLNENSKKIFLLDKFRSNI